MRFRGRAGGLVAAVGQDDLAHAALAEMRQCQQSGLAGADQQQRLVGEFAEHVAGGIDGHRGDGQLGRRNRGLGVRAYLSHGRRAGTAR